MTLVQWLVQMEVVNMERRMAIKDAYISVDFNAASVILFLSLVLHISVLCVINFHFRIAVDGNYREWGGIYGGHKKVILPHDKRDEVAEDVQP